MNTNKPICLFDSGIGGLTVLKKLINKFSCENYVYLADLANVPFGDKSHKEIQDIALTLIDWLNRFNPKIIIMACNASSACLSSELKALSLKIGIPIYGVIESCTKEVASSNYKKVSVWTTKVTSETKCYTNFIHKRNPKTLVEEIACPKLVPFIESLNFNSTDKISIFEEYLNQTSNDSEAIILGCTHYPLIQGDIKKLRDIEIIDPADGLVRALETYCPGSNYSHIKRNITLYATDQVEKLQMFSKIYLCEDLKANLISLKKVTA